MLRRILLNEILPGQIVERDEDGKFYILTNDEIELRRMFGCLPVQEEEKKTEVKSIQQIKIEKKMGKIRIR